MKMSRAALAFVAALAVTVLSLAQTGGSSVEQTYFHEDELFEHPVSLPPEALNALLATKEAQDALPDVAESARNNLAQFFQAAEVHLASSNEADFVVIGLPPMSGVDNTWFWLVRPGRRGPQVVLFAGGNSLEIMKNKTNGYRNIRSLWSSASETEESIYHFDGRNYRLWKRRWMRNRW